MQTLFIPNQISYTGSELKSHWIYRNHQIKGDAIVAFIGACKVDLDHMVDLEDVIAKAPIFSELMLHFIIEHFDHDLENMVLRQRLLISIIKESLEQLSEKKFIRNGDDIFSDKKKLTVSIATASPISTLIHTGINISSKGTPVPTMGLDDIKINPKNFAEAVLLKYKSEMESVQWARSKVRAVP